MKFKFENTVTSLNEILNVLKDTYGEAADVGFGIEEGIPVIHLRFNGTETTIKEGDTVDSYGVVQDSAQYLNERWHPYPEEKPFSDYKDVDRNTFLNMEVSYICTIKHRNETFMAELTWLPFLKKFKRMYWIDDIDKYVIAWTEFPEPYERKKEDKPNI